jgi:uncharacterized protein
MTRTSGKRGFASMDADTHRAIASKGGKAAHAKGTGHEWTSETARLAGRKGGLASRGGKGKQQQYIPPPTDTMSEVPGPSPKD